MNIKTIVIFLSTATTALSAGLFFAWVISVIPGTKKIPDQAYMETMQSINREILNPAFFIIFFGSMILLFASTYFHFKVKVDTVFYLILGATLLYAIGTIGVTMFGNVPLNNIIEAMDLTNFTSDDYKSARLAYEAKWNFLNLIRTLAALGSFLLLLFAIMKS